MNNEKMKIGIDIDEIVVEYIKHYLELCEEKLGRKFPIEEISQFNIWKVLDISEEEVNDMTRKFNDSQLFKELGFVEGAKEAIDILSKDNELFFITSRPKSIMEGTHAFFNNHLPNIKFKIIFSEKCNGNEKTKAQICNELGVKILIEDRRKYALDCAENGIKVLLMDKPWNRNNCEHKNIIRVRGWGEIMERIWEMKKGDNMERIEETRNKGKNIVEEIRKFVEQECKKPTSKYGYTPYGGHFVPVVNYSKQLAMKVGADIEVVEIAAWLHDIGAIVYGRENHHITGAEIAEKKLKELGYPEEKIEKVKHCILVHRGSQEIKPETIEAQIIIEADVMSGFNNISGLFECAFVWEKLDRVETRKSVRQKLINKWNQLSPESKELIKPKYEAAMLLLK